MGDAEKTYGERLKDLREALGLSLREAAKRTEGAVKHSHIGKLEKDLSPWKRASLQTVEGLARAYNKTVNELIREVDGRVSEVTEDAANVIGKRRIPVYRWVSAGPGADGGDVVELVDIPDDWVGEYVAYLIEGDSMAPKIEPGSKVIVKIQDNARPGQLIVCFTPEYGMLIKQFARVSPEGFYVLTSFNPAYDPIYIKDDLHIKGYVKEVRTPYPNGNDKRFN